jgi:hypothetical protein
MSRLIMLPLLFAMLIAEAQSAQATQIPWCMRVVPSGELVFWYGNRCR